MHSIRRNAAADLCILGLALSCLQHVHCSRLSLRYLGLEHCRQLPQRLHDMCVSRSAAWPDSTRESYCTTYRLQASLNNACCVQHWHSQRAALRLMRTPCQVPAVGTP